MATLTNFGQGPRSALPNRPFGFTATAGRLLLLWVSGRNTGSVSNPGPPTDDPDWVFLGYNRTFNPVGFQDCAAVFGLVAKGGETSFDPKTSAPGTFPGPTGGSYFIQEWSGAGLADVTVVNANKVGSGVNLRGTEFEAVGAGTAIGFFVQSQDNVKTFTPVAGWTIDDDHSSSAHPAECLVSSDTLDGETYQPSATSNRNNGWRSITIVLGDEVPPPPPVTPPLVCALDDEDLAELVCIDADEIVDWSIRMELQGTGSGFVVIHRSHLAADTDVIKKGNWLAVKIPQIDADALFVFQMERITTTLISNEEGGGEVVKVAGRGNLSYFDRAVQHPRSYVVPAGLSVDGIINGPASTGNKAGQVIKRSVDELTHDDRGVTDFGLQLEPLAHLTHDFDYDDDSNGDPWDTTDMTGELSQGYVGEKGLVGVLELIGTGAIDIIMWPTFLLQAFNSFGRDLTGSDFADDVVRFVRGANIAEELVRDEGLTVDPTHTVVQGSDGTVTAWAFAESPVYTSQPHVEGHVSTFGTDNTALEAVGVAEMSRRLRQGESIQFRVATPRFGTDPDPVNGLYLPGPEGTNGNYWLGDMVTLDTGSGFRDYADLSVRVMAITIKSDQAGDLEVTVELLGTTLKGRLPATTGSFGSFGGGGGSLGGTGAGGTGGSSAPGPPAGAGVLRHVADASDAHDASAISVVPFGSIAADNVQDALEEIVDESGGGDADGVQVNEEVVGGPGPTVEADLAELFETLDWSVDSVGSLTVAGASGTIVNDSSHNNFPGLARLDARRVLCAYRKGTNHAAGGNIVARILTLNDTHDDFTVGDEFTIRDDATLDLRVEDALSIIVEDDGTRKLCLPFRTYDGADNHDPSLLVCDDPPTEFTEASTWTLVAFPDPGGSVQEYTQGRVIRHPDGTFLCGGGFDSGGTHTVGVFRWTGTVEDAATASFVTVYSGAGDYSEITINILPDGTVRALGRSDTNDDFDTKTSADAGATWSSNANAFDGHGNPMWRIFDSTLGASVYRVSPNGDTAWRPTTDFGATWGAETVLDATGTRSAYASMLQLTPEWILIAYAVEYSSDGSTGGGDIFYKMFRDSSTFAASIVAADELVKVSSNDTTAGYLADKIVAGSGVTITELDDGSVETLEISVSSSSIWRPVMAFDVGDDHWYVVVDGDGTAVMAEG